MSEIVAKCTNSTCNKIFAVPDMFRMFGGGSISFSNISTPCPTCGAPANILPGIYKGDLAGVPKFASGPADTAAAVSTLRKIIAEAKSGKNAEEIVRELESYSPKLGSVARGIVARKGIVFLIAALSYILAACDAKLEMKLDWNIMADQLHHYATGKDPYPGLTERPKPRRPLRMKKPKRHHGQNLNKHQA